MKTREINRQPVIRIELTQREALHVGRILNCGTGAMDFSQDLYSDATRIVSLEGTDEAYGLSVQLMEFAGYPGVRSFQDEVFRGLHEEEIEAYLKEPRSAKQKS